MRSSPVSLLMVLTPLLVGLTLAVGGCKELTGSPGLPAGTPNPSVYNNATGAVGMYTAAVAQVDQALFKYIIDTGLLTDELEDQFTGASAGMLLQSSGVSDPLDERILPPSVTVASYGQLQAIRTFANQAIGALAAYDTAAADTATSRVYRGELYALDGYADIMLADLFCSGVPLSTLDFQKDFTVAPSSTTTQVYQAAIAKFDTALSLASASDSVVNLARVGQGRAYLDLGQYAMAADDVKTVPTAFRYDYEVQWLSSIFVGQLSFKLSNREGLNGLPFRSNGDPRTATTVMCVPNITRSNCSDTLFFPTKYSAALSSGAGVAPVTLASGYEARLIEAEAELNANPNDGMWLATLNALRTANGIPTSISDPVDPAVRVDTLFTERAYWLYLTGHRQGDLRRLIRNYGRRQDQVYPTGPYLAPGTGQYGADVVAPIPPAEAANPLFHGCLSNDA